MVKVEGPNVPGWDEPPLPIGDRAPRAKRSPFQHLGLRHIMISLLYFAALFWAIRRVMETNEAVQQMILGVLVGLGFCILGLWAAMKMARYAFIGWIVFIIGYMTVTGATTSLFAVPTLPILIGAIIYLGHRRRANDQDGLLWVLAVAAERGMPLGPGVRAFSGQVSGIFEVWTESLANLLRQGASLPDALDALPKLVPRTSLLLIRMGWESGNLAAGLREAVDSRARHQPVLRSIGGRIAYLSWVVAIGLGIVSFVMYFIIPKFEAIFKDFGVELPRVTILVIQASHVMINYSWVVMLGVLGMLSYLMAGLFGRGDMSVPLFDRLFARRHTILILRSLAVVVSAGRPVPPALDSLAHRYPTGWVRRKLGHVGADANQGVDWAEALHSSGLISSSDLGVLASATRAGNLPWALLELAETGERRWAYRLQAWTQFLFVLAMLALGGLVFVIAVAYFAPLTTLITRLAR